jgi:outer membrane protein assembly factor BamB
LIRTTSLNEDNTSTMKTRVLRIAITALFPVALCATPADDWHAWRGPNGNGVAASGQKPVTSWSETENVVWKSELPGRGHSTPVVVGKLVVLTTADESAKTQSVIAFDRKTGAKLWERVVHRGGFLQELHKKNTQATPTIASDGKSLFASFCNRDAVQITKLDLKGKVKWTKNAGPFTPRLYQFGYAPSPVLYGKTVIVSSDFENGFIAAFATSSGRQVWRTPRRSEHVSYSSPIIGRIAGRDQLLISGRGTVNSYNPKNGKLLWSVAGTSKATCGTMIWAGNVVFASGGYPKKETLAVLADGSKRVLWRNTQKCYEQSMLFHDGHVYAFNDNGIAICWRAKDGKEMWKKRLQGPVSASPTLANGNIYATNERGTTFVFKADPSGYVAVTKNQVGDEAFSSPTICGDQIFLRHASRSSGKRQETLFCIGD